MMITPITEEEKKAFEIVQETFRKVMTAYWAIPCSYYKQGISSITVPESCRILWRNQPGEPYYYKSVKVLFEVLVPKQSLRQQIGGLLMSYQQRRTDVTHNAGSHEWEYFNGAVHGLQKAFELAAKAESDELKAAGR